MDAVEARAKAFAAVIASSNSAFVGFLANAAKAIEFFRGLFGGGSCTYQLGFHKWFTFPLWYSTSRDCLTRITAIVFQYLPLSC